MMVGADVASQPAWQETNTTEWASYSISPSWRL